jgi:hypothetical protein
MKDAANVEILVTNLLKYSFYSFKKHGYDKALRGVGICTTESF